MDEGGQVVTLDVDQFSRPLILRGMVADVRRPLVSALELRNAGLEFIVGNHGSRLVHRKSGERANFLERAGVPLLPVRPREQMDSVVSPILAEPTLADFGDVPTSSGSSSCSGSGGAAASAANPRPDGWGRRAAPENVNLKPVIAADCGYLKTVEMLETTSERRHFW